MSCAPFTAWNTSDTIALGALIVALWAGWSARQSAVEAKRANTQAMYHERRAVFDAFFDLSMHMTAMGQKPDMGVVGQFYRHLHTAAFCFDKEIVQKLVRYYEAAFAVADFARAHEGMPKLPEDVRMNLNKVREMSELLLADLKQAVPVH